MADSEYWQTMSKAIVSFFVMGTLVTGFGIVLGEPTSVALSWGIPAGIGFGLGYFLFEVDDEEQGSEEGRDSDDGDDAGS